MHTKRRVLLQLRHPSAVARVAHSVQFCPADCAALCTVVDSLVAAGWLTGIRADFVQKRRRFTGEKDCILLPEKLHLSWAPFLQADNAFSVVIRKPFRQLKMLCFRPFRPVSPLPSRAGRGLLLYRLPLLTYAKGHLHVLTNPTTEIGKGRPVGVRR